MLLVIILLRQVLCLINSVMYISQYRCIVAKLAVDGLLLLKETALAFRPIETFDISYFV